MTRFDPIWAKATRKSGQPMAEAGAGEKLKVFISYSRKDSAAFADELVAGLELAGFEPFLDRHDIAAGEEWERRLRGLIQEADTVVFVVSPEAIKSERCKWEVDKTVELSKRLLPVIFKPVLDANIPEKLRQLQFVRFDTGQGVTRPLSQLAEALRQDIDWIREHTRIGELAARWQARGRPESLLLRGDDLDAARHWAAKRKPATPEITDAQRTFIRASEKTEKLARRRTRRVQALVGALMVLLALGGVGWWNEDFLYHRGEGFFLKPYRWFLEPYRWRAIMGPRVLTIAQEKEKAKPGSEFSECVTGCPTMVVVPAGKFMMGSPSGEQGRYGNEGPQHPVTIAKPFAVGETEVTFAEWDACVAAGACAATTGSWGRGKQPAINVSWDDAKEYVAWLSRITGKEYRLLTEAEWEYAARAGTTTAYSWGDKIGVGNANCNGCGSHWDHNQTAPVGSFKPNAFGLYDMYGNVEEWVEDAWHESYKGAPVDGTAWLQGSERVFRNGSWASTPQFLRAAFRGDRHSAAAQGAVRGDTIGFRVARTLNP